MSFSEAAKEQGRLWGTNAESWAEFAERSAIPLWTAVLDAARVGRGTRLLDAGCGSGGASTIGVSRGAIVNACDASAPLLGIARSNNPDVSFEHADLESLPYQDRAFDAVIAVNSLQFTSNPVKAAHELLRVRNPSGLVAIAVWSFANSDQRHIFAAIQELFDSPPRSRGVFNLSEPGEVEALFPAETVAAQELPCPFVYNDLDSAVRLQMSAGATQKLVELFGRETVVSVMRSALKQFERKDGEVILNNRFRLITAGAR